MCGLVACVDPMTDLTAAVAALDHRGPDHAAVLTHAGVGLGHTRLAIQDLDARSNQPYRAGRIALVFNGEVFNPDTLRAAVEDVRPDHEWRTTGDTEALAWALDTLGPVATLDLVAGMFALAWADERQPGVLHLARDRMGEIPLHVHRARPLMAASELKAFTAAGRRCGDAVVDVPPGEYWNVHPASIAVTKWASLAGRPDKTHTLRSASRGVRTLLARGVARRSIADVGVCTLLSGGVDSAAITAEIAARDPDVVAYTARLDPRSRDLRRARETAAHLGIKLVEVSVPSPTAADLAEVVRVLEMPHKAQVEIGWACLHLAHRIAADGYRVVYSGEASDELWGSYGNSYFGIRDKGWFRYRRQLFAGQSRKNFPRVNKAFMHASVEARLPFCDPDLVRFALSLPPDAVQDGTSRPKAVLQRAYDDVLPDSVPKRPQVAFQDGLGLKDVIARTLDDPRQHYAHSFTRAYG